MGLLFLRLRTLVSAAVVAVSETVTGKTYIPVYGKTKLQRLLSGIYQCLKSVDHKLLMKSCLKSTKKILIWTQNICSLKQILDIQRNGTLDTCLNQSIKLKAGNLVLILPQLNC